MSCGGPSSGSKASRSQFVSIILRRSFPWPEKISLPVRGKARAPRSFIWFAARSDPVVPSRAGVATVPLRLAAESLGQVPTPHSLTVDLLFSCCPQYTADSDRGCQTTFLSRRLRLPAVNDYSPR